MSKKSSSSEPAELISDSQETEIIHTTKTRGSITAIGACLGAISRAKVHESIAWVNKQNMASTVYGGKVISDLVQKLERDIAQVEAKQITTLYTPAKKEEEKRPIQKKIDDLNTLAKELDVPALTDETLMTKLTPVEHQKINDKRYLFLCKHVGQAGSYWNDSFTADVLTSDYGYIETNRTIDKALRGVYKSLLPQLNGPLLVDPNTSFLSPNIITHLEKLAEEPLIAMETAHELSGFKVTIPPDQSVLGTSKLDVQITLIPVGVLREIHVSVGFNIKK